MLNKCKNMINIIWIIITDINRKIKALTEIFYNRWITLINKILNKIVQYNYCYYYDINHNSDIFVSLKL